jgi:hypothetical protein
MKYTPIVAILVIGALMAYALSQGIDGLALAGSVAIIAGLGGFTAKSIKDKVTKKD